MFDNSKKSTMAVFATLLLAVSFCLSPMICSESDAADGDSSSSPVVLDIVKGQKLVYTPTFPSTLSPTITIPYQGTSWTSTAGNYATVSGSTVTVTIPAASTYTEYYVVIKASATQPTQTANQYVKFNISDRLILTGTSEIKTYVDGSVDWTPSTNMSGATFTVSPALPTGLSMNSSTGKITGTPTTAQAAKSYTVTAKTTSPAQTKTLSVSITVEAKMTISGTTTVYAAVGGAQDTAQVSCNVSGVTWSISSYGTLDSSKISVDSSGNITVTPTSGSQGTHNITMKATSPITGQTATKSITVVIKDQLIFNNVPTAAMIVEA